MYTAPNGATYQIGIGTWREVYDGVAYKTKGGVTAEGIIVDKYGRLKSRKKHDAAKKNKNLGRYLLKEGSGVFVPGGNRR